MKKIILFIIFIILILNISSLNIGGIEGIDGKSIQNFTEYQNIDGREFAPEEILVKFKGSLNLGLINEENGIPRFRISSLDNLNTKFEVKSIKKFYKNENRSSLSNVYKLKLNNNIDVLEAVNEYNKNPNVEFAQPNYKMNTQLMPNDDFYYSSGSWNQTFDDLYGLKKIYCEDAWEITTGSDDVVVAVIDTGVDYNHLDIKDNMWINQDEIIGNCIDDDHDGFVDNIYGADFVNNDGDPFDDNGHGTHCSGAIGAVGNNFLGVVGVNWNVKIMAVKGLDKDGSGYVDDLASAIYWAADNGAKVISNSWGPECRMPSDPILEDAVRYAYSKSCVVVFSAGNSNDDVKYYSPNCMNEVITVAATDHNDLMASFSNWGEKIDVCAPGVNILSLRANNARFNDLIVQENYLVLSGTSMACPYVSGLAALLLSKDPTLLPDEIKSIIKDTSDEIFSINPTGGRINVKSAIWDGIGLAEITRRNDWSNIKGTFIINGSAWAKNFHNYILDYGRGKNPSSWTVITNSFNISENLLGALPVYSLKDGLYTLRLRVFSDEGIVRDFMSFIVNNEQNTYTIDDDPGADFKSIQDGVDEAGTNDIVLVRNGTFTEQILINHPINLIGESNESTIIQGFIKKESVILVTSEGVLIKNFKIVGTTNLFKKQYGIYLFNRNNIVNSNNFIDLVYGIYIWNSSSNLVSNNYFFGSGTGICIEMSNNNIFSSNTIFNSGNSGIRLYSSNNNIFEKNEMNENKYGILFNNASYNKLISNKIIKNQFGIYIESDSYKKSENNTIYCNSFIKNFQNAKDNQNNHWDDNEKGNYWDDYIGKDNNSDGIGDTPYSVSGGNNKDNYPLGFFGPEAKITKPEKTLYIMNMKIMKYLFTNPLIVGRINIEVDAYNDCLGVDRVEFYVDGKLIGIDYSEPFSFIWNQRAILNHKHFLKIVAIDNRGRNATEEITVWKFL